MTRLLIRATVLVVLSATSLSAQALALLGGGVTRWNQFPESAGLANTVMFGGRVGLDLTDRLLLESDITYNNNVRVRGESAIVGNREYRHIAFQSVQTRLTWQQPVTMRADVLLGMGHAYNGFSRPRRRPDTGSGLALLGGVQRLIGPYLIIRADATMHRLGSEWSPGYQVSLATRLALAERASE